MVYQEKDLKVLIGGPKFMVGGVCSDCKEEVPKS